MAIIYPSFENISRLKVQPTEGEFYLLNYLSENLNDEYEIFFNPFLDGDRPDFIILKKNSAIFIVEVKDYNLSNYFIDEYNKWHVQSKKGSAHITSPQSQAFVYKSNLFRLHIPALGLSYLSNRNFYNIVHPYVYIHGSVSNEVSFLYDNAISKVKNKSNQLNEQYRNGKINDKEYNYQFERHLKTNKNLSRDRAMIYSNDKLKMLINKISSFKSHVLFDDRVYDDFKRRLMPSEHTLKQGRKIPLDSKQIKMATSVSGKEKIKGVAGCGKTQIIANRAVDAYKRHCGQVLILTFNITLKNLIRDRISDVLNHRDDNHFAITNYHQFYNSQLNECGIDINTLIGKYGLVDLYQHDVFRNETVSKYKTILIDEVQDFESEWVKITRDNFLEPDGEMVLFGDQSQNIYERDDGRAAVIAKGFGDWKTLTRSYRISSDSPMNYLIKSFQTQFLINKHSDADIIEVTANQIAMNFDSIKYHSYDTNDWEEKCFSEIQSYIKGYNLNPNDIVILSSRKYLLRKVSERFNKIEKTHCMFDTYSELYELLRIHDKELSLEGLKCLSEKELYERYIREYNLKTEINDMCRIKKNHFYANSGLIKLSTTHSFKGLESKTVFYILDDKDTPEVIYTSITRAIENIIILDISVEKKYKEFFCGYVI